MLWFVLSEAPPLSSPSTNPGSAALGLKPGGSSPCKRQGSDWLGDGSNGLPKGQGSVCSVADRCVWEELCELPYCFVSVVCDSGLERFGAAPEIHCPDWLLPASWFSGQWSLGVLSPRVLGVPPQGASLQARPSKGLSNGEDEGEVVGWEQGRAWTIWIPPIGIIR